MPRPKGPLGTVALCWGRSLLVVVQCLIIDPLPEFRSGFRGATQVEAEAVRLIAEAFYPASAGRIRLDERDGANRRALDPIRIEGARPGTYVTFESFLGMELALTSLDPQTGRM